MSTMSQTSDKRIALGFREILGLVVPYATTRILDQIKSVWLIVLYLVVFLRFVLGLPVADAALITAGIVAVIVGLGFFMDGLMLGLMPLGEIIGLKLPQKSGLATILIFAVLLGMGATFAEPAIGVLKAAGASVLPWEAPLLFLLLNRYSPYLVYAVAFGVGIAVMAGMLRFMYGFSLKPFIYALVGTLTLLTIWAALDPNLRYVIGVAWDCGAVTTGPVTVPLVLALGLGITRIAGKGGSGATGFGVVTLASLFPIIAVLGLGIALNGRVPPPLPEAEFYDASQRSRSLELFSSREEMIGYALGRSAEDNQAKLFAGGHDEMLGFLRTLATDDTTRHAVFGVEPEALDRWAVRQGSARQRLAVFGDDRAVADAVARFAQQPDRLDAAGIVTRNSSAAAMAVLPLAAFLVGVLWLLLRERLPSADEVVLGIVFAVIGMSLLNIGIEIGLGRLGNQVGGKLPALFQTIELPEQVRTIVGFDLESVETAVTPQGEKEPFFYMKRDGGFEAVPFDPRGFDEQANRYTYVPTTGPLFGAGTTGQIVLLIFAFIMGYGATLAEPALNALGFTVEDITVGAFKKALLMQAVAIGVGLGIALGVAKIVWALSLPWLLLPPYMLLLLLTWLSTEDYVNIGWDSAGVTTGPVTVPLVLAMGLGIGSQIGGVEGFGILAMASVCPILSVLLVGLYVNWQRRAELSASAAAGVVGR